MARQPLPAEVYVVQRRPQPPEPCRVPWQDWREVDDDPFEAFDQAQVLAVLSGEETRVVRRWRV